MTIFELNVDGLDRAQIRSHLLRTWEAEPPGSGQYRYNVETCADGSRIYLLRPANLNKGCDFVIISENYLKWKNGNDKRPKHEEVFDLIKLCLVESPEIKDAFIEAADLVFNCENIEHVLSRFSALCETADCKAERALKLLKWLWIEQDITYWTGTGRNMLKKGLDTFLSNI